MSSSTVTRRPAYASRIGAFALARLQRTLLNHLCVQLSFPPFLSPFLPFSYPWIELDAARKGLGDATVGSHRCATGDPRWGDNAHCVLLDKHIDEFWNVDVLPMLAVQIHRMGMDFVFLPATRQFGGESISRRQLIGRPTTPSAWECSTGSDWLALSVPIPHPSTFWRLGDAVPQGESTVGAVVAAVVGAVSEAAAAAAADPSGKPMAAKRRRI